MISNQNEPRKTPIALFFYLLISKILPFILLNLLFIFTSLPLITFPQSLYALHKSMQYLLSEGKEPVYKIYFRAFKTDVIPSFAIGILSILMLSGIGYGAFLYYLNGDQWIYLFFFILLCVLFIIVYAMIMWVYMMLVMVKLPLKLILKNAIILTFSYPKQTLFGSLGSFTVIVLGVFYFPYSTPILLLILFAFACFIAHFSCDSVIQKHIIRERP